MKTPFAPFSRLGTRSSLLAALAAAALAGCGGQGQPSTAITEAPTIKTAPKSVGANVGDSASFSVSVSGRGLTYRWYKGSGALSDTANVSGSDTSKLTINPVGTADFGTYYVKITNDAGSTTSGFVTLGLPVTGAPTITTQPTSITTTSGSSATFTVVATGTGDLTYQWFRNGTAISGANGASYTVSPVTTSNTGSYYVAITNAKGTTESSTVSLSIAVPAAPVITSAPQSKTVLIGRSTSFTVIATGVPSPSYQWYHRAVGATDFDLIPGATNATYTVSSVDNDTAGEYKVVVTNSQGSASATATLTAAVAPTILDQPQDKTAYVGGSVTFTITASGTAPLTYKWYRSVGNGADTLYATTTVPSLTINPLSASDAGTYRVVVSNPYGFSDSSRSATLVVLGPPVITTQPANATVGLGSQASFTVAATGSGTLTYQWYKNGTAISGATGTTYTTPATTANDNGATFYVKVTSAGTPPQTTTSRTATLKVDSPPTITAQPQDITVTAGQTATFSVTATVPSGGNLFYQWRKNGAAIPGARNSTYMTPATVSGDNGAVYSVEVRNDDLPDAAVFSRNAVLTVNG